MRKHTNVQHRHLAVLRKDSTVVISIIDHRRGTTWEGEGLLW